MVCGRLWGCWRRGAKKFSDFHLNGCDLIEAELRIWDEENFSSFGVFVDSRELTVCVAGFDLFEYPLAFKHKGEDVAGVGELRRLFGHVGSKEVFGRLFAERFGGFWWRRFEF